ncbi:subtilisin-like protein [Cubamyces lactineus]|nr:subtilisin-like protein [Cubamyces lactineus]
MVSASAFVAFVCLGVAVANPLGTRSPTFQVHERREAAPPGFTQVGPAPAEQTIRLRLALAQSDPSGLIDSLYQVSDPDSASYGRYLSKDEVERLVAPQTATVNAVNAWLKENDLVHQILSPAGDWISIELPVGKANDLFDTEFSVYRQVVLGVVSIRTLAYSLPESLQGHVDLVHPTISFPTSPALKPSSPLPGGAYHSTISRRDLQSVCGNGTTVPCLQELYNIPLTPAVNKDNQLGVTGFIGDSAHYAWLETFLETYRPDMDPGTNFSVVGIDGGVNDQNEPSESEGELDIQYTVGLATDVPVTLYFIGLDNQDGGLDGFLDEANAILALDQLPHVLTTSYGLEESSVSFALTDKLCQAYAQLGVRGTSVLFASGDSGPGCGNDDGTVFQPTFPSNCPFVTSVGGTQSFSPEEAWSGSGGGFSNYYPRPAYQDAAVSSYLKTHSEDNEGAYNASGRAFPDIAAKADKFTIYGGGSYYPIYGTSAASPTVASIVALVNDRLESAGRPPLGFLNPWLYKQGYKAFTDITTGNSSVRCTTNGIAHGFNASVGWDPVTGLGTPRFDRLLGLLNL